MGIDAAALEGATPIRRSALVAPSGTGTHAALRQPACCIRRRVLDATLRERALAAGCRALRHDVRLDEPLDGYDVVIDARGAHADAANAVGLRAYWHVPRDAMTAADRATVRIVTDGAFPRGYGWIFPLDDDGGTVRVNVGVGMLRADARHGHTVREFMDRFTSLDPLLRRLASVARQKERPLGYHVGLGGWRSGAGDARALRIGDAANLADPLTGDGIGNALRSGYLVAEAVASSRSGAEALSRWRRAHARHFAGDLRRALALRWLLQPTGAKNAAARVLACSAVARERLHAALFGETSYRGLLLPRA
jgi:flavin-dependent dehydrogenase